MKRMLLAVLVAATSGCLDGSGPGSLPTLPGLVVSAPVQFSAVEGSGAASPASPSSADVAYVSLEPGSVPDGRQVLIRNQTTSQAVSTAMVNGGFDPVAIVASIGDQLLVEIARAGSIGPLRTAEVVRRRPPRVVRTSPPRGGRDVPLNANVVIVFSTPINATTLTTGSVTLWRGTTSIAGTVGFADDGDLRAEFHADTLLAPQTEYELVVTTAILDVNGLALDSAVTVPFTTGTLVPPSNLVFTSVSAGYHHSCGLTTTGAAYCWGDNYVGTLGDGTMEYSSSTPMPVAGGLTFATLSSSAFHTCGVTTSGVAYCWGTGGIGTLTGFSPTPVPVLGGLTFASVSSGYVHTCGLTPEGAAYCWGEGYYGELGDGTTNGSAPPVPVAGGLTFAAVSAGTGQSCGVTTTGAAYCWGMNALGELGIGASTGPEQCENGNVVPCSTSPVAVVGGLTFATLSAGGNGTCGVTTSSAAYCWGNNEHDLLGNGTRGGPEQCADVAGVGGDMSASNLPCSRVPVTAAGGLNVVSLSTGERGWFACGLTSTGAAYCWGGDRGDGNYTTTAPVAVAGGLTFATLSAGGHFTCGITTAGVAYCWGANDRGQLGNGTTTPSSVPVKVAGQP